MDKKQRECTLFLQHSYKKVDFCKIQVEIQKELCYNHIGMNQSFFLFPR